MAKEKTAFDNQMEEVAKHNEEYGKYRDMYSLLCSMISDIKPGEPTKRTVPIAYQNSEGRTINTEIVSLITLNLQGTEMETLTVSFTSEIADGNYSEFYCVTLPSPRRVPPAMAIDMNKDEFLSKIVEKLRDDEGLRKGYTTIK